MLTQADCIALCDLSEAEIAAIARHEHVPMILAAEIAQYLIQLPDGVVRIRRMILDDIADAKAHGHADEARRLKAVLHHFAHDHPAMRRPVAPEAPVHARLAR